MLIHEVMLKREVTCRTGEGVSTLSVRYHALPRRYCTRFYMKCLRIGNFAVLYSEQLLP